MGEVEVNFVVAQRLLEVGEPCIGVDDDEFDAGQVREIFGCSVVTA